MSKDAEYEKPGIISNYDKLQSNKKEALAFTTKIAKSEVSVINNKNDILSEARASLADENFEKAILKLDQLKDAKLGIVWHESSDLGNGTSVLVRDARNTDNLDTELFKEDAGEKYAMQLLNEIRSGIALLDTDASHLSLLEKEEAKAKLKEMAEYILDQVDSDNISSELNSNSVKEFNTAIIDTLEKAGIKDTEKKLNFAKEVSNFKDEHRHIVTLTSAEDKEGQKHTVIEAEIMLNGLTEKQTKMYQAIANSKRGALIEGSEMAWYNYMPQYKREMLHDVAGDIATGNKVIPAQLLSDVVGLRNAYQKVSAIQKSGNVKILAENLHCGAPATKIKLKNSDLSEHEVKAHQEEIVNDNIEQLQSFVEPGIKLNLNNLTSKTPIDIRGENFIHKQMNESKNTDVAVTTSPINKWRKLGAGREQKEFDNTLKDIGKDLKDKKETKAIASYLEKGESRLRSFFSAITFGLVKTNFEKAQESIKLLNNDNPKLAKVLDKALTVKKLLQESTNISSSENINLDISKKMNVVDNAIIQTSGALHNVLSAETKKAHAIRVDFCKSGKDRTGLVQMENTHEAVSDHLGIDSSSELGKKNKLNQAKGGHIQEMAGVQGGSIGCHSIKTNPEFALNKSDKAIDGIVNQKSSKFNSSIKVVKDKEKVEALNKVNKKLDSYKNNKTQIENKQEAEKTKKSKMANVLQESINIAKDSGIQIAKQTDRSPVVPNKKLKKGEEISMS